jgi:precorrin-8X/cobalt-precorrin-8 methylmutase
MTTILPIKPAAIETRSFAIIEEEFFEKTGKHPQDFGPEQFAVLRRTIHATGDFSFAETIRFHNDPITMAIAAIKAGKNIITDVLCKIADADIARQAAERGTTRAEAALRATLDDQAGILAIGNAPTALLQAITMIEANPSALASIVVIGVPVGFVNAVESKELLNQSAIPHITSLGRKGGSPVAAAIINALVKLAAGLG